jgi:geranylgeranyl diphosphate synthase type I
MLKPFRKELMILPSTIQSTLARHQQAINIALREAVNKIAQQTTITEPAILGNFYGQMRYHLGWVDAQFTPTQSNPGKLLRPTLLLLAYEASGAWGLANDHSATPDYLQRALPAAVAIELAHNFTLIHDDIEDGDDERRHRATLWKLWGIPQGINTGDGMFALARLLLWDMLDHGVEGEVAARLGVLFDRTLLTIAEGQYLDISFEARQDISVAMYLDMISRKTAALMACAAEIGARLGTSDNKTIQRLHDFGQAIGIAFQVRDDQLGIWASTAELGKTPAGDIYRRKKSLPILHALEHAGPHDQQQLRAIYQQEEAVTAEQVAQVLAIFERTQTRQYCRTFLKQQCQYAYQALANVPRQASHISARALDDLETLVSFIEEATKA